jgi:hypothetical protein
MMKFDPPLHIGIVVLDSAQLAAVYALLGGASVAVVAAAAPKASTAAAPVAAADQSGSGVEVSQDAADDGTVDAHGWPWSPDLHASTKGTTKEGLWRMKVGVSRPDPKPGFPKGGASESGTGAAASSTVAAEAAGGQSGAAVEEDDEFAQFRAAAAKTDAEDAAAKASVPPRKWTDADLGALCNQAAVKLGDPAPVKAIITEYVPAGEVPHSRNIPDDKRAAFAAAVEAKAGIEFVG